MELKNRKILMFRCHIDPHIPPKPRNAFMVGQDSLVEAEMTPVGIYAKATCQTPGNPKEDHEHFIPFTNIQSIKLAPVELEVKEEKKK